MNESRYPLFMDERQEGPRVFISYARESQQHIEAVRELVEVLRRKMGIDATGGMGGVQSEDWPLWMTRELAKATHILLIASSEYKRRGDEEREEGYGVEWEGGSSGVPHRE